MITREEKNRRRRQLYKNPKNKARIKECQKNHRQKPEVKKRIREYNKEYNQRPEVKQRAKIYHKEYSQKPEVKKRKKIYQKAYHQIYQNEYRQRPEVKLKTKAKDKEHYRKYREEILRDRKEYNQRPEVKKHHNEYHKKRRKTDKNFLITWRLRSLLSCAFRKYTKTGKVFLSSEYGIDYNAILTHLQPFPENISEYHIDHIKPLCSFTFIKEDGSTDLEQVKKAFSPENHQWLTAHENMSKGGKY